MHWMHDCAQRYNRLGDHHRDTASNRQGVIPAPVTDSFGYSNTLYMVYFPPDVTISAPGLGSSCKEFCGYHSSAASSSVMRFAYGVIPDFGGSCGICGSAVGAPPMFRNITDVSSHEFAESISDARPASGWYDPSYSDRDGSTGAEIADVCEWQYAIFTPYTVQPIWSNLQGECVSGRAFFYAEYSADFGVGAGATLPFMVFANTSDNVGVLTNYRGTIHFKSSDPAAQLPADYTFTAADRGSHTFAMQFGTPGQQQVNMQDADAKGIKGNFTVSVNGRVSWGRTRLPSPQPPAQPLST